MHYKKLFLFSLILFCFLFENLKAVPAYPFPVSITQPDGTTITVIQKGDEFHHYYITKDGFPIIKNSKGIFNYAKVDDRGNFVDTNVKANDQNIRTSTEKNFISSLDKNVQLQAISQAISIQRRAAKAVSSKTSAPQKAYPTKGSPRSLVILVNFSDLSFVTSSPKAAFTDLLNKQGYSDNGGTGSARDYFIDNSMGTFSPQFDVVGPFTLPQTYAYYGANDSQGQDKNAVQMIVDACTAANNAGVDFSLYDTDNDYIVDNVFVYYAGHNEAENGGANTVWPHRWGVYPTSQYSDGNYSGSVASITFDGRKIQDYACTSELRGASGTNMAGIGTFTHEFGHVLGLVDMYPTDGGAQFTLSYWDIMDSGPYLNNGRTPPAYNSFERFQLGFLTPVILKNAMNATLNPLTTSNSAYLISQTDASNLNGSNPVPTEFFLLENRQKTGWDTFLPGHGMMIYRVNYSQSDWDNNVPNNNASKMDFQIMCADGIGSDNTLSGDPFPGSANVTSYIPVIRSGTALSDKPITDIKESNQIITFKYKGGGNKGTLTENGTFNTFTTVQGTPSGSQSVTISGTKLGSDLKISFNSNDHFEMKKATDADNSWAKSILLSAQDSTVSTTQIQVRYNPSIPSYDATHSNLLIFSAQNADSVKIPINGKSSRPIYVTTPVATAATEVTYKGFIANWNVVMDNDIPAAGYYVTVYSLENAPDTTFIQKDKWVVNNTDTINYLVSDRDYYYSVKASDKNLVHNYENITSSSNTVQVHVLSYPSSNVLRVVVQRNGAITTNGIIKVFVPSKGMTINVYNELGQKVKSIQSTTDIVDIEDLPRNHVYILQSGNYKAKVIL